MAVIRDFKSEDYEALVKLWKELELGRPERGDDLQVIKETLRLGGKMLIMEEAKELIGIAWITNNGRRLYLHHMGIKKDKQGKGYGRKLMEEVLNFARFRKMQIKLEVHDDNSVARKLYEKYGFGDLEGYRILINRNVAK